MLSACEKLRAWHTHLPGIDGDFILIDGIIVIEHAGFARLLPVQFLPANHKLAALGSSRLGRPERGADQSRFQYSEPPSNLATAGTSQSVWTGGVTSFLKLVWWTPSN